MRSFIPKKNISPQAGDTIVYLLVIIFLYSIMMLPIINTVSLKMKVTATTVDKETALQIAEAGINYYQWHLAHFPDDFKDGTNSSGPYIHDFVDSDTQKTLGQFSLVVTPPSVGSTVVTIQSTGYLLSNPNLKRTITTRYGIPSLAQYSFLSNDIIWIGENETVGGQLQSNNGIRFDGTGNATISSAKSTYSCPSSQGSPCPAVKNGIWGSAPQSTQSFWKFPVPAVDFSALTSNLANMKSLAQSSGIYLSSSNKSGYSLVFNSDGTVDIYKVTRLASHPSGWDVNGVVHNESTDYQSRTLLYDNKPLPSNGIIYIEDKVWVEGTVRGKVMVAASILPYNVSNAPTIYIPKNIVYASKDGSDVLGLLAQDDIVVTYGASTNLEIDAALVAQNGSVQFFYYPSNIKNSITVYGSIMTFGQWTWTYVSGSSGSVVSGYRNTASIYDGNLLYGPPPSFPLSTSGYQQLSWKSN